MIESRAERLKIVLALNGPMDKPMNIPTNSKVYLSLSSRVVQDHQRATATRLGLSQIATHVGLSQTDEPNR